eukprot:CAMPEP_0178967852 /NCGR_PEP_ID=MMETSP0789-20121207/17866_1 /TAXON_ID=3005 /ORGANISM="Rhizosolenia setigera, Strain CCMP 1694" /LENGTH=495 /DNA_ID=CAMNT_0020653591 /DNA_START=229 /DNA_END=1716 /DNA_ORIENTATION=+
MAFNIRGGAAAATASSIVSSQQTPDSVFNLAFSGLALVAVASKVLQRISDSKNADKNASEASAKPAAVKSLQLRFLSVFWLIKCADWLQGPYFYEVYKSKVFNGAPATLGMISKIFLAGFASTALFGPAVGKLADSSGRKKGTLLFCALYTLGALSTKSPLLAVLLLGRLVNGIGTSLLFSAPESWLVGEAQKTEDAGKYLGETFGLAYAGDSIVAILAGKLSGLAAAKKGPTGPFELSTVFLAAGALLTSLLWKENVASSSGSDDGDEKEESSKPTIKEAVNVVKSDSKIMLVGAVQALFEAAMYIFVLQWPPAITSVIGKAFPGADTPYGTIFTCFMTCCLLGSTAFGQLVSKMSVKAENFTAGMLSLATISMACATIATIKSTASSTLTSSPMAILGGLSAAFFLFEACVGMYFPSIGTLRSKYVPDSHRGVIMNLFGIPLNALVITVFLISEKLGVTGALGVSTGALGLATLCMMKLKGTLKNSEAQAVAA